MADLIELSDTLGIVYLQSNRILDRAMAAAGVSLARYRTLRFVQACQPTRARDVAEFFGFAPRTVTEALDGLERHRLVERTPDPTDRRSKRITLTVAGQEAIARSDVPRAQVVEQIFGVLSADEQETLMALLAKLADGMGVALAAAGDD